MRKTGTEPAELPASPEELAEAYHLEGQLFRLRVRRGSRLAGRTLAEAGLGRDYGVTVVRIERAKVTDDRGVRSHRPLNNITGTFRLVPEDPTTLAPGPDTPVHADDVLLVEGQVEMINRLAVTFNLGIQPAGGAIEHPEEELLSREIGLAEILITPRSALIGQTLVGSNFGDKYNVRVLQIWRRGKPIDEFPLTNVKLAFGDALLVRGTWKAIGIMENESRNFVVVGRPAAMTRPKGLSPRAIIALLALLGMLIMLVTGAVSTVVAVLITAMIMVLTGCLTMEQAYRGISWESVVLIAAMLPMAIALENSGGAQFIAEGLVNLIGTYHPLLLLMSIFLLTTAFTQIISNTATTVLLTPIVLQAATGLGVSPLPMMMIVAIGASTAFLTPIASPVNTLVLTPGGYHFSDFIKAGLPLLGIFLVVSLILVPLIWPL